METRATLPFPHHLPEELIIEILLRLPVKCLLRLKCVSKSWFSLISDTQFAKYHYELAAAPTHRLLLKSFSDFDFKVIFVDIDDDSADVVFYIPNPIRKHVNVYNYWVDVVGSCRGFLLLTTTSCDFSYFVMWNPSTGVQKMFEKARLELPYLCGFGYDSSTDDYVVVTVTFPPSGTGSGTEVHCFSSRTNSWSCTEITVPYTVLRTLMWAEFRHGLFLNGALHWLIYSYDNHPKIIAFDLMERSLSEIPLPHELEKQFCHLRAIEGCLCLCIIKVDGTVVPPQMWTMKEYKVQSSWTKSFVFFPLEFLPICFTKNGEIFGLDHCDILARLNDKGELHRYRELEMFDLKYGLLLCGVHTESLLSLPDGFQKLIK